MYNGTLNLSASATGDKALQKDADALSSIVSALDTFTKLKKGIQEVIASIKDFEKNCQKVLGYPEDGVHC